MSASWLIVPVVGVVGLAVARDDARRGVIANARLAAGLGWGALLYALVALATLVVPRGGLGLAPPADPLRFVAAAVGQGALALAAGFALYMARVWSAGDAKLFALLVFLLPPDLWRAPHLYDVGAAVLLVNTFVTAALYSVTLGIGRLTHRVIRRERAPWAHFDAAPVWRDRAHELARMFAVVLVVLVAVRFVREGVRGVLAPWLGADGGGLALFLALFVLCEPLGRLLRHRGVRGAVLAALGAALLAHWLRGDLGAAARDLGIAVAASGAIALARLGVTAVVREIDFVAVAPADLRAGHVLHDDTVALIEQDADFQRAWAPHVGPLRRRPLTKEQAVDLPRWYQHGRAHGNNAFPLGLRRRFPFAAWLVFGALLTLAAGGDVFGVLRQTWLPRG